MSTAGKTQVDRSDLPRHNKAMRIYISHANQDNDLARTLVQQLAQAGFDVWNPDEEIGPGDNWGSKIGQALDECDLMVALMTREALQSDSVKRDIEFALTSRNYSGRLIPVFVNIPTLQPGKDVPWILLKMDPIWLTRATYSNDPLHDVAELVKRVQAISQRDFHAAK